MRKNQLTEFGKEIKYKLIDLEKNQEWLISEIKKKSKLYVDSSLMNRIMTGQTESSLVPIIKEILGIN